MKQKRNRKRKKAGHRSWAPRNAPVEGEHQGDIMSPEKRSAVMSRIRSTNTGPERTIMEGLQAHSSEFETHCRDLPGRPDIVFRNVRIVVFIDGDFWHGWRFPLWAHKLSPKWQEKIAANRERDQRNFRKLRRMGWKVIRIWEHQIENDSDTCVKKILAAYRKRLKSMTEHA